MAPWGVWVGLVEMAGQAGLFLATRVLAAWVVRAGRAAQAGAVQAVWTPLPREAAVRRVLPVGMAQPAERAVQVAHQALFLAQVLRAVLAMEEGAETAGPAA
jgi:hypothetical protein